MALGVSVDKAGLKIEQATHERRLPDLFRPAFYGRRRNGRTWTLATTRPTEMRHWPRWRLRPHAVVPDINMPGMNGIEAAAELN
jgi:CheY-like chemotaxis protein